MVQNRNGALEEDGASGFSSDALINEMVGETMIQGPDGLWYSRYSVSDSGLRLSGGEDEMIEGKITSIEQLNTLLEMNAGKSYLNITIPDISALIRWERSHSRPFLEDIALESALRATIAARTRESLDWAKDDALPVSGDQPLVSQEQEGFLSEEVALQELNKKFSTLPPRQKAIRILEKVCKYRFAWWESEHPLVRLWGQLDSGVQVIGDKTLVLDLVQVLGREAVHPDQNKKTGEGFTFAALIGNAQTLKNAIREKYAEHQDLLDAIISTQK